MKGYLQIRPFAKVRLQKMKGYLQIRPFAKVRLQKMTGYLQIRPFAKVRLQNMKGYLQIHRFAIKIRYIKILQYVGKRVYLYKSDNYEENIIIKIMEMI